MSEDSRIARLTKMYNDIKVQKSQAFANEEYETVASLRDLEKRVLNEIAQEELKISVKKTSHTQKTIIFNASIPLPTAHPTQVIRSSYFLAAKDHASTHSPCCAITHSFPQAAPTVRLKVSLRYMLSCLLHLASSSVTAVPVSCI